MFYDKGTCTFIIKVHVVYICILNEYVAVYITVYTALHVTYFDGFHWPMQTKELAVPIEKAVRIQM